MSQPSDGGPACAWCERPSHIRQGRLLLCAMHYRMSSMRTRAARDGKSVPAIEVLERLAADSMICAGCGRTMHWLRSDGASGQATLQHDRSGAIRLLCLGCNTRHAQHPGDSFYEMRPGTKLCHDCGRALPLMAFATDRSRPLGRKAHCRSCAAARNRAWRRSRADALATRPTGGAP
jgi:hypothetical protein